MIAAEFFAGIGLARIGLEQAGFEVAWSNDIDQSKRDMYCGHFRDSPRRHRYQLADVASVSAADLPEGLALAWASFPCVDVSLAGWRRGFRGSETSTFWQFARVMDALGDARPPVVALENVLGLATSHKGQDLRKAIAELNRLGYVVDVLAVDALRFVPQSRQRLFLVGMLRPPAVEAAPADARDLRPAWLDWVFDDASLHTVRAALPEPPPLRGGGFAEVAERLDDADERWWDSRRVKAFEASLSPLQAQRLDLLRERAEASLRTAYRRTRHGVA
ncbi:MAG: DNA cytosine methyltransferase, partial [Geminicoccales bacterium]